MWWTCCVRGIALTSALLVALRAGAAGPPAYDHIVIVVEENDSSRLVYGEPTMPFLNSLANGGAKFTHSFTATTPYNVIPRGYTDPLPARGSQPNYLYLFGGNHQGMLPTWFADPTSPYNGTAINDSNGNRLPSPVSNTPVGMSDVVVPASRRPFTSPNLGAAIMRDAVGNPTGLTYVGFSDGLPDPTYDLISAGAGDEYVRRHNPTINWVNLPGNAVPANKQRFVLPLASNSGFAPTVDPYGNHYDGFLLDKNGNPRDPSSLPTVSLVVPNDQHNGHSNTLATEDAWLQNNLGPYAAWAQSHNSLLIVTWDEDGFTNTTDNPGVRTGAPGENYMYGRDPIPTIFYGAGVVPGTYAEPIDHLNLLATVLASRGRLDQFKQDFAAAYPNLGDGTIPSLEHGQELANLRPILDAFGAGPALTPLAPVNAPEPMGIVWLGVLGMLWLGSRRGAPVRRASRPC